VSGLVTAAIYRLHPRRLVRAFGDVVVPFRRTILAFTMNLLSGMSLLVFLQSTPVLGGMVVTP
jgi:hypothetical protein